MRLVVFSTVCMYVLLRENIRLQEDEGIQTNKPYTDKLVHG